jgi:hypothetical protein
MLKIAGNSIYPKVLDHMSFVIALEARTGDRRSRLCYPVVAGVGFDPGRVGEGGLY